jgi:hypothetical protein
MSVKKRFPTNPANPERLCWGCDRYCAADNMMCGNGSDRTQHPVELFGPDWKRWGCDFEDAQPDAGEVTTIKPRLPK